SRLRSRCDQLRGSKPGNIAIIPAGGFGDISRFARVAFNLYEQRILADYDPTVTYSASEVRLAISDAGQAIAWFNSSTREQQTRFPDDAALPIPIGIGVGERFCCPNSVFRVQLKQLRANLADNPSFSGLPASFLSASLPDT